MCVRCLVGTRVDAQVVEQREPRGQPPPRAARRIKHEGDGAEVAQAKITEINRWYAGKLSELCARLDSIPEPGGSLLDNTLIVWVNELGRGNSHSRNDLPIVMAGSAGGAFDTGRYLEMDRSHADLLRTIGMGFGLPDEPFGRPDVNDGAITTLLA